MKRTILIMTLMLVALGVNAQTAQTEKTLYIVDGVVTPKEEVDALKPEQIKNMNIVNGIDKAVVVTTTAKEKRIVISDKPHTQTQTTEVTVYKQGEESIVIDERLNGTKMRVVTIPGKTPKEGVDPLIVIKKPNGEFEVAQDYGQFETNNIKTITVLKDEESQKRFSQYGDTSKGIVLIELK